MLETSFTSGPENRLPGMELVASEIQAVETELKRTIRELDSIDPIPQLLDHLIGAGGKRLRPLLALLGGKSAKIPAQKSVRIACAAEWIHSASLLHDDIVDDSKLRRNRPAVHTVWGNKYAVLGGDYCLSMALDQIEKTGETKAFSSLNKTVRMMVEAEILQLKNRNALNFAIDDYYRIIEGKTAALMAWCASCGGIGDPSATTALLGFGKHLGLAFQIADDVFDLRKDRVPAGKSVGQDLKEGNLTLPVLLAAKQDPRLQALIHCFLEMETNPSRIKAQDEDACSTNRPLLQEEITAIVRESSALQQSMKEAETHARKAAKHLDDLDAGPVRSALAQMAYFAFRRSY